VADALEILAQVNDDAGARESVQRQVSGIEQDRGAFETELAEVLALVGIARKGEAVDQTRLLALALRDAVRSEEALATHAIERNRLISELERVQRRLDKAKASIEKLMGLAGAAADAELDQIIAGVGRRDAARAVERDALAELAGTDNGAGFDALALEIASLPIEEEAAARARIEDRLKSWMVSLTAPAVRLGVAFPNVRKPRGLHAAARADRPRDVLEKGGRVRRSGERLVHRVIRKGREA
jgi:hypothetical protein